jgi:hypothetical protein
MNTEEDLYDKRRRLHAAVDPTLSAAQGFYIIPVTCPPPMILKDDEHLIEFREDGAERWLDFDKDVVGSYYATSQPIRRKLKHKP